MAFDKIFYAVKKISYNMLAAEFRRNPYINSAVTSSAEPPMKPASVCRPANIGVHRMATSETPALWKDLPGAYLPYKFIDATGALIVLSELVPHTPRYCKRKWRESYESSTKRRSNCRASHTTLVRGYRFSSMTWKSSSSKTMRQGPCLRFVTNSGTIHRV